MLHKKGYRKSLVPILGKPIIERVSVLGLSLIERIILTTKRAGIKEFVIVVGYLGEKIKSFLGNGNKFNVKIDYIENNEWHKGNGVSVLRAKNFLHENFILLMSDHIFDGRILMELIDYGIKRFYCVSS